MGQKSDPMVVVYVLFACAALFSVLAVLAWLTVISFGIEPEMLAALFALMAITDAAVATVFLVNVLRR